MTEAEININNSRLTHQMNISEGQSGAMMLKQDGDLSMAIVAKKQSVDNPSKGREKLWPFGKQTYHIVTVVEFTGMSGGKTVAADVELAKYRTETKALKATEKRLRKLYSR